MSDALFDDESEANQEDSHEDVMTPAELIARLEEVSRPEAAAGSDSDRRRVRVRCFEASGGVFSSSRLG